MFSCKSNNLNGCAETFDRRKDLNKHESDCYYQHKYHCQICLDVVPSKELRQHLVGPKHTDLQLEKNLAIDQSPNNPKKLWALDFYIKTQMIGFSGRVACDGVSDFKVKSGLSDVFDEVQRRSDIRKKERESVSSELVSTPDPPRKRKN